MSVKADLEARPSGAIFSADRVWRYALWRDVGSGSGSLVVVGLNPSTADERVNDPTIRRCVAFARDWGYRKLIVLNLFAFRATKPDDLRKAADPVGPENDRWLRDLSQEASLTLAAWGNDGLWRQRASAVVPLLASAKCLGTTKLGAPRHPLYVRGTTLPTSYP
jgi:hypothetical protein